MRPLSDALIGGGCHSTFSCVLFCTSPGVPIRVDLHNLITSVFKLYSQYRQLGIDASASIFSFSLPPLPSLLSLFPFCFHLSLYEERSEDWKRLPIDLSVL
jgi:hypothetical protein